MVLWQTVNDEWDVPAIARKAFDIKGKTVGTAGGGRIAFEVMKRLEVSSGGCMSLPCMLDSVYCQLGLRRVEMRSR